MAIGEKNAPRDGPGIFRIYSGDETMYTIRLKSGEVLRVNYNTHYIFSVKRVNHIDWNVELSTQHKLEQIQERLVQLREFLSSGFVPEYQRPCFEWYTISRLGIYNG